MAASTSDTSASPMMMKDIKRRLFASPGSQEEEVSYSAMKSLMNRLQIDHDVEACLRGHQKDVHNQNLSRLRQMEKELIEDNWRYTPIENIINGL